MKDSNVVELRKSNDAQIIDFYWNRDAQAISASMDRYGAYCFSIADGILNNAQDAEECVNDTWLRAWNAIPPTRPTVLKVFFAKITRHLSFDKYKAEKALKRGGGNIQLVLDELAEIKICTAYRINGKEEENFPADTNLLNNVEAIYETLPGWQCDTTKAKCWADLPENAKKYLLRVAELLDAKIGIVSVGPDRDQTFSTVDENI